VDAAQRTTDAGVTPDADLGPVEMTLDGFANGGSAVGRLPDGRACFVAYGIPGERVVVDVTDVRRRWARGTVIDVLEPSPDRVPPPCPLFGPGRCGGCTMQHIGVERQAELLGSVIADQVRRIAGLEVPGGTVEVLRPHGADGLGYRNRARFAVTDDGRLAFRRARSHDLIPVADCPLLTAPARAAQEAMAQGWRNVSEVQLQVGSDGSGALAVTATGGDPVIPSTLPAHVVPRGRRRRVPRDARVHHEVAGHTFVTGATSFFQASAAAAEVLADRVVQIADVAPGDHVVDCYAGVGMFSVILAAHGARVTAIESDADACADARRNAQGLPIDVVRSMVADARAPTGVSVVVLDPPRTGAGADAIAWIVDRSPQRVAYVSCDPATFARDARHLDASGYRLTSLVGVDQFTHTGHVELIGGFARAA
jgi:tRNA/tmRNA/rRNA uracil-C5-methylase (TrmA/RlmC/RlmD family)